ncbi:MAG: 6-carboxytetrahydropterin synthase [Lachnospiraceae bacterium]|nr:6-carboxytetrahydropterin synthase [Lachnospiraceae bacterium]
MENKAKYILGFFIEISHSADGNKEHAHEHTLEISMVVSSNSTRFLSFNDLENVVKSVLMRYDKKYINDFEEFGGDATVENIGEVIYAQVLRRLTVNNMTIHRFTIAETPLRTYIITEKP